MPRRLYAALGVLFLALLLGAACGTDDGRSAVRIESAEPAAAAPGANGAAPPATGGAAGARAGAPAAKTVVFVDVGHGGRDPGWGSTPAAPGVPPEKDLALDIAKRTQAFLERDGFAVVLSRTTDTDVNEPEKDLNGDGFQDVVDEIQARIDLANGSKAAVLLSLHMNGLANTPLGGVSTWYNDKREFAAENKRLAILVQQAQIKALTDLGYPPRDWGIIPDDKIDTPSTQAKIDTGYKHFYLIGPVGKWRERPSTMPGVLAEPLFLTNVKEATLAGDPAVREALAKAYADAVREYLGGPKRSATLSPAVPGGPATVIERGQTKEKVIALTFDAGKETSGQTAAILDTLARANVKASFGLTGKWCETNPELARRIADEGHMIFNHTFTHASWTGKSVKRPPLTAEQRRDEIARAEEALLRTTGTSGRPYFRSPFGDADADVARDLGELGYRYNILWSFDTNAWRGAKSDQIVDRGRKAAAPGAIYVFHISEQQDALALEPLIAALTEAGYRFVTVAELFPTQ